MIYHIYFILMNAGNSAIGFLLGSYMKRYGDVRDSELGYLFMIAPMTIFLRPLICAQADRRRAHRQFLAAFLLLTGLAYAPFILVPFVIDLNGENKENQPGSYVDLILAPRARFWLLASSHLLGSVGYCGVRALGDALTVNYAKLTASSFGRYRKYGSMSLGVSSYLLGFVNQDGLLPDFVPAFIVWCGSYFLLAALVYAWPEEYFRMVHQSDHCKDDQQARWPSGREIVRRMANKWLSCSTRDRNNNIKPAGGSTRAQLSIRQQLSILCLLVKRDFRVALYSLVILYAGLVGYSGPNFVFTQLNEVCQQKLEHANRCDSAKLASLMILLIALIDTVCYLWLDYQETRRKQSSSSSNGNSRLFMLEVTFVSLTLHYCFFGLLLPNLSPWFFLVESLHGLEYSISLTLCVELGYLFANEVELLIPELASNKTIDVEHEKELVKVSLMATMNGYFTLLYEGFGCILGSFVFGQFISFYSFTFTWILIGLLASIGLIILVCAHIMSRCVDIEPELVVAAAAAATATSTQNSRHSRAPALA